MQEVVGEAELQELVEELARRAGEFVVDPHRTALVGIRTRGVPLAQRISQRWRSWYQWDVPVGAVDITLYRDDLDLAPRWPVLRGTEIPFDIDRRLLVLVDDVLYTGRTVRAALDALCDLGRPQAVRLAVLVDRGHRELPIQPDAVALRLPTHPQEWIEVRLRETDGRDAVLRR
jgi:pyrimidine operon attenuation protein/uracil phosphoribosyltransferase